MKNEQAQAKSFSQFGEDQLIWEYFGEKADGFFIEVGANHPIELSQTWLLEQHGWHGLLVEPLPHCCERLRAVRHQSIVCETAVGAPEEVGEATLYVAAADAWSKLGGASRDTPPANAIRVSVQTLESICREHKVQALDFLSIDVEGMEVSVLKGFDLATRRPALVLLEDHLETIDLCLYMWSTGYRLAKRSGCNNWWIPAGAAPPGQSFREKASLWNRILFRKPFSKLSR